MLVLPGDIVISYKYGLTICPEWLEKQAFDRCLPVGEQMMLYRKSLEEEIARHNRVVDYLDTYPKAQKEYFETGNYYKFEELSLKRRFWTWILKHLI